jgi:hypothetical protein
MEEEMSFTDSDLERWKSMIQGDRLPPFYEVTNLLARLEAAEQLCGSLKESHSEEAKTWRKEAGK